MVTRSSIPAASRASDRPLSNLDAALRGFLVQRISVKDPKNTDTESGGKKTVDD